MHRDTQLHPPTYTVTRVESSHSMPTTIATSSQPHSKSHTHTCIHTYVYHILTRTDMCWLFNCEHPHAHTRAIGLCPIYLCISVCVCGCVLTPCYSERHFARNNTIKSWLGAPLGNSKYAAPKTVLHLPENILYIHMYMYMCIFLNIIILYLFYFCLTSFGYIIKKGIL